MVYNNTRGGKYDNQRDKTEVESVTKRICGHAENTGWNNSALGTGMPEASGLRGDADPGQDYGRSGDYRNSQRRIEILKGKNKMYVITMKITTIHSNGEYAFNTKKDCQKFLDELNDYEIEQIISIEKYNKHSCRSAWHDFFEY